MSTQLPTFSPQSHLMSQSSIGSDLSSSSTSSIELDFSASPECNSFELTSVENEPALTRFLDEQNVKGQAAKFYKDMVSSKDDSFSVELYAKFARNLTKEIGVEIESKSDSNESEVHWVIKLSATGAEFRFVSQTHTFT
ncbi:hypothetical protein JQC92_19790 [Shewanella sp. 202IG2-18]|uniref:hypothetical protein n=1 Tax=Parashewanella hymeniacidonis TaxID=2807618 RepID=UPI0019607EB0|nr:hypothetical protein [Parashewanella hymeniacidonis]MBM7074240.1 hypothetical protein [Parashewanella hymeniacidonis]